MRTRREDQRRRLLLVLTDLFANGGIQRFNRTLIAACVRLGIECDVLSLQDNSGSIARAPVAPGVTVRGFGGDRIRFVLALAGSLWRGGYRWIFIGHVNLLCSTMLLARTLAPRTPTLLVAHGIEVWYHIGAARRRALRRVSTLLCVSRYTRARVLELSPGLDARRARVFPNALGDVWLGHSRAVANPPLPERYILSVTRLHRGDRYKGLVSALEALSMVPDTGLHHVIVGHGNDQRFLQAVAARLGLARRVHFFNRVTDDELVALYSGCVAFVLPSGKEGFGIVFLEAMYFGAPVIAAAEKGALDVVRHEETGLLVRFGDVAALHAAIHRIGSDTELRERLRGAARAAVTAGGPFTFERFVDRTAEALAPVG